MIPAGSLDRRLTIQKSVTTRDASGAAIESFQTVYANVPAMIKPSSGREKFHVESGREIAYKQYRFVIRYIAGLTPKHRVVFEGENYDILFLAELPRREGWDIYTQVAE